MKVATYCRVSTDDKDQNPERQRLKCEQYANLHNHIIVNSVEEHHKGDSNPFERPGFKTINLKQVDGIIVFSIDRLTRQHPTKVMNMLNYFKSSGINIMSVTEPIFNTESEFAEPMQYFMSWWNNYFLKKLSADVKSGLDRARAKGKILGRPKVKYNRFKVIALKNEGKSIREIAKVMELSIGTVQRCIKNHTPQT